MITLSDFDKANVGKIIHDPHMEWTSAHILRFIDKMINKGVDDYTMGTLLNLFPEYFDAIFAWYGWPKREIDERYNRWRKAS
jgi:hypothetical protein